MTQHTLFVCALCRFSANEAERDGLSGGQHLINQLEKTLDTTEGSSAIRLQPVRCMAACDQACTAVLAAPNKLTFIFHELEPEAAASELAQFCGQYAACADGRVPYHSRSQAIRQKTSFILPPLPTASVEAMVEQR